MNRIYIVLLFLFSNYAFSQDRGMAEKVWRINFVNPGGEVELPISKKVTFTSNVGVGYGGSYPELTEPFSGNGIIYVIAPFVDLQVKAFYNFDKRLAKGKSIKRNSGNFLSARIISRGPSIADNVEKRPILILPLVPHGAFKGNMEKYICFSISVPNIILMPMGTMDFGH